MWAVDDSGWDSDVPPVWLLQIYFVEMKMLRSRRRRLASISYTIQGSWGMAVLTVDAGMFAESRVSNCNTSN